MAVQIDGTKCAYIRGECECHCHDDGGSSCCCGEHGDEASACSCETDCCGDGGNCGCCSADDCIGCAEVCPEDAICRKDQKIMVDQDLCTECGLCMTVCAYDAIYILE